MSVVTVMAKRKKSAASSVTLNEAELNFKGVGAFRRGLKAHSWFFSESL